MYKCHIDSIPKKLTQRADESDHEYLVRRAHNWLSKTHSVVFAELKSYASETPDVIGWKGGLSTTIECKASLADFKANRLKNHGPGMGIRRYFLFHVDVMTEGEFFLHKESKTCGLLLMGHHLGIKQFSESKVFEVDYGAEILTLTSALRRIKTREFISIQADQEIEQSAAGTPECIKAKPSDWGVY